MNSIMIISKAIMAINQDYHSQIQLNVWSETKNVLDDFSKNKEMFDYSNYFVKSKYYDD